MKLRNLFIVLISLFLSVGLSNCKVDFQKKKEVDNFPIILQESEMDCGPVCLKMLCDYYKKDIDLERLGKLSSYKKDEGTSLLGLSDACTEIGIENLAVSISYEKMLEWKGFSIAHWYNDHFIIVYKMDSDSVWVADPAIGKIKYSKEEFCEGWYKENEEASKEGIMLLVDMN